MSHALPAQQNYILLLIGRSWAALAPKVIGFLAGGLTPTLLISLAAIFAPNFHLDPVLAALIVTAVATFFGWFVKDGELAGLSWNELAPKLITLAITSGLVTTVIAILTQVGITLPAWLAALLAVLVPAVPGWAVPDKVKIIDAGTAADGTASVITSLDSAPGLPAAE